MDDFTFTTSEAGGDTIRDEVLRRILEDENPYMERNGNVYDVHAVNVHFVCSYTDEEITQISQLCYEMLEELKRINENGYTKKDLGAAKEKYSSEKHSFLDDISIYNTFSTEKIEELIGKLAETVRIGGTYFILFAKPLFIQGICVVYDYIIDGFEDPNMYFSALFMLMRMAMRMHSDEVNDNTNKENLES